MSPQQGKPGPGDFTGRQKQQQAKEQAAAVQERQQEMSMMTAAQDEAELVGIFDPQTQERIDEPAPSKVAVVEETPAPRFGGRQEREPVFTGQEPHEEVEQALAARKAFTMPVQVRSSFVTIRVDQDVEDMTYGMRDGYPNNYTFREGQQYRVPIHVAEHLNERGLVRQWG